MKAVVMAGGFGTRIQPLTTSLPKPMLPVVNRPMMEHIIIKLKEQLGITEFVILLYFKPETIKDYFKDGGKWGVKIEYVLPDDDYGTAGAVKCAQEFLQDDNFIIVSGDLVTDFDFRKIVDAHNEKNALFSIALTPVEDPLQFGVVITDENDKIEKFLEKPGWGEVFSDTINTGIYIVEPQILDFIPSEKNFDFAKDLFPLLMENDIPLWGPKIEGYWRDVGNPQSYRDVYDDILNLRFAFSFDGNKITTKEGIVYTPEDDLSENLKISGIVVLGNKTKIGKNVVLKNVVLGDNVVIRDDTKISNSVIWSNVKIGKNCDIDKAVICDKNRLANNIKIKEGVIMAENCDVLDNVSFEKDVVVWADKIIDENSIVSNNVVWGSKYKSSIFEDGMVRGRTNIELSCTMSTKLAEALGTMLPVGSKVYVSRDFHRSSRMLKRAFLGGLLSTGLDVVDITYMPSAAMRYSLANNKNISAGVHFRQSITDKTHTEIIIFTEDGLRIDTNMAKNIERVFFRENFRRVDSEDIGEITEVRFLEETYIEDILSKLDLDTIKSSDIKIAVDMMSGAVSKIYPKLLTGLELDNIVLNAVPDEKKLSTLPTLAKKSQENLSKIVSSLERDIGLMIYPNGQKMRLICDEGKLLDEHIALLCVLYMVNYSTPNGEKRKIFLPAWTPDIFDEKFENLKIERGKYSGFTKEKLSEYYLVASVEGNFAFIDFAFNRDTVFASLKVIEMMTKFNFKLSSIAKEMASFYYQSYQIECPNALKGTMMRRFLQDSKTKRSSMIDGVKIWIEEDSWILMIPDQYSDFLNLYIQAPKKEAADAILQEYKDKISSWKQTKVKETL